MALVAARADLDPARHTHLLHALCPPEDAARVLTWRSEQRRQHWLAGRAAAQAVGVALRWTQPHNPAWVHARDGGAPALQQAHRALPLSITHSGPWALAAAAPGWHLGIDYEVGLVDQFHLTQRICAPGEAERHGLFDTTRPREDRRRALEAIWALKEALLKAFGVGLIAELRHFEVAHLADHDGLAHLRALAPLHPDIPHPLPDDLLAATARFDGHALALVASPSL